MLRHLPTASAMESNFFYTSLCSEAFIAILLLTTFSSVLQTRCGGYFHGSQNWAVDMTAVACGEDRSTHCSQLTTPG
ncbi:hypothetical protein P8452_41796 [Trifolium repens]|nr:hypothetical protein P8452_41796 [Trifolium repens]